MRVIEIGEEDWTEAVLQQAAEVVRRGEVLVCPTDTCYILVANALDEAAVATVLQIKQRPSSKPIHVIVSDLQMAAEYVFLSHAARRLAKLFLPGPLTLVLPLKANVPRILTSGRSCLGIRIPDHGFTRQLAHTAQVPITATSANISGHGTPYTAQQAVRSLAASQPPLDLVLDQGPILSGGLSTIVDLASSPPRVLREGLVRTNSLLQAVPDLRLRA